MPFDSQPYDKRKNLLLDANLLTVYIVSQLGNGEIEKNKKTRNYTTEDAYLLCEFISSFRAIVTTPHVLTETANLLDWIKDEHRKKVFSYLTNFIQQVDEYYLQAKQICPSPAFLRLGLTDAMLIELCQQQDLVLLTADLPLYHFAIGQNLSAINFHHLRQF